MALFTKPIETALKARDTANTEAQECEAKAAAMRAEADQLDASANAAILEDESAAERITTQVLTLQRKASAYDQAARQARAKARAAARDVLSTEADELDKEAAKTVKLAEKHELKVSQAKAALESLDECAYERVAEKSTRSDENGLPYTVTTSTGKAGEIRWEARRLATQAQVNRYWLSEGKLPARLNDLNDKLNADHTVGFHSMDGAPIERYGNPITDNLREAMANDTRTEGE